MMLRRLFLLGVFIPLLGVGNVIADDVPNLDSPTFGGKQFWTDEFVYLEWRIQRQVLSTHYRLLDQNNVRRAWGTFDECQAEFKKLKSELNLPPLKPRVVIALHGLVRSRDSMSNLCRYLEANGDFTVLNVSYASSREKLADHAKALGRVIDRLEGVREINFVAHSLGNLVIRHYLGDSCEPGANRPQDPRIHRIVMLAPPNQGTDMALRFKNNLFFQAVWGESGRELAETWPQLQPRLACPTCEFGVIAGGKRDGNGYSPLLEGDDDFVVSVAETRLPGARDFSILPVVHGAIMESRVVHEQTLRFLEHGHFVSEPARVPILNEDRPRTHE
jgi:pimeloyl-ACP methyl ester carboxylesterase